MLTRSSRMCGVLCSITTITAWTDNLAPSRSYWSFNRRSRSCRRGRGGLSAPKRKPAVQYAI